MKNDFKLIVAVDDNGCIGFEKSLPFKLKEDLKIFKAKTINNIVIMGRKTFESFGSRPLPNRDHYILSRTMPEGLLMENVYVYNSIDNLMNDLSLTDKEKWVIGGAEIYNLFYDFVEEFHVTHINESTDKCDTYFKLDYSNLIADNSTYMIMLDEKTNINYEIMKYTKIK